MLYNLIILKRRYFILSNKIKIGVFGGGRGKTLVKSLINPDEVYDKVKTILSERKRG